MSGLREDEERPLVARVAVAPNENTPVPATRHSAVCLRFTLLLCVCIIIFSGYFSYDLPSITSAQLKEHPFDLTNTQLGLLFTVYALPNTILPLFSGTFYTRLGVWRGIIAIGTTIAVGIIVIAIGVGADSFSLMMLGRAIYGIGGESLYVGVDVLTTTWFKGSELGLAYGLVQAAGQAGSFTVFLAVPPVLHEAGGKLIVVYMMGTGLAVLGVLALFLGRAIDVVRVRQLGEAAEEIRAAAAAIEADSSEASGTADAKTSEGASADHAIDEESMHACCRRTGCCGRFLGSAPLRFLGFHHLLGLSLVFWCDLIAIAAYNGSYFTFLAFGNDFLQNKYDINPQQSGFVVGAVSFSSVVLSPLSGILLDKFGGSEFAAVITMALSVLCFALLGLTRVALMPVIGLAGFCYGVLPSALYPLLAEAVPEESFAEVYAILTATINLVLSASMVMCGRLSETVAPPIINLPTTDDPYIPQTDVTPIKPKSDYTYVFVLFIIYTVIGTACCAYVAWRKILDMRAARAEEATAFHSQARQQAPGRESSVAGIELEDVHDGDEPQLQAGAAVGRRGREGSQPSPARSLARSSPAGHSSGSDEQSSLLRLGSVRGNGSYGSLERAASEH